MIDRYLACFVRHVVEIAYRIGRLVVDRRRNDAVLHDERADRGFEAAGSAEEMAGHRFGGADGNLVRLLAEHRLDRQRLDAIADRRRRAVCVDVVDVVESERRVLQGALHDPRHARSIFGR